MVWKLFSRKQKKFKGKKFFFERWIEKPTKTGIVFYSTLTKNRKPIFIVEGYGVGTINPRNFREFGDDLAPIQRYELVDEKKGRKMLEDLKQFNYRLAKGENFIKLCKEFPKV